MENFSVLFLGQEPSNLEIFLKEIPGLRSTFCLEANSLCRQEKSAKGDAET
jgi:hypothetical protein